MFFWGDSPQWARASSFTRFLDLITDGRAPLDESSARRRDLYLKTHYTHNRQTDRQTSMLPVGFEGTISAGERPLAPALKLEMPNFPMNVNGHFISICETVVIRKEFNHFRAFK